MVSKFQLVSSKMLLENVLELLVFRLPVDVLEIEVEDVAIVVTLGLEMHVPKQLVKVIGVEKLLRV